MGRVPDLTRVSNESEYASTFDGHQPDLGRRGRLGHADRRRLRRSQPDPDRAMATTCSFPRWPSAAWSSRPPTLATSWRPTSPTTAPWTRRPASSRATTSWPMARQAVADRLASGDNGRTIDSPLIDQPGTTPGWNQADLLTALFPTGGTSPKIDSINAHYDHTALEPSAVNAGTSSQLEVDSDLVNRRSPAQLAGHLLFTMGCHAGLSVPDAYVPGTTSADAALKLGLGPDPVQGRRLDLCREHRLRHRRHVVGRLLRAGDGPVRQGARRVANRRPGARLRQAGLLREPRRGRRVRPKVLQQVAFYGLPFWYVGAAPTGTTPPPPPSAPPLPGTIAPDPAIAGLKAMPLTETSTLHPGRTAAARSGERPGPNDPRTRRSPTTSRSSRGPPCRSWRPSRPPTARSSPPCRRMTWRT